jgi:hypothetical protein
MKNFTFYKGFGKERKLISLDIEKKCSTYSIIGTLTVNGEVFIKNGEMGICMFTKSEGLFLRIWTEGREQPRYLRIDAYKEKGIRVIIRHLHDELELGDNFYLTAEYEKDKNEERGRKRWEMQK